MEGSVFFFTSAILLLLAILCMRPKGGQMINPQPPKAKSMSIEKHLKKLGFKCKDKVSGFEGVITHVGFDLFGCVQAIVNPGIDNEGKPKEVVWFDLERLDITSAEPVMLQPDFLGNGKQAQGLQGAAEKPMQSKA